MATAPTNAPTSGLDRYFKISERGSTVGTEIRAGVVTFFAMAYIIILNPLILSTPDVEGTVLSGSAVAAATALTAGVMTVLFGLVTRLPFAFAAGLGINAFLAFSIVGSISWPEAMALVVINGVTTKVKVAHLRLCHSRMLFVRAYPRESQEMVFDAHDRAFAIFKGACTRGIYDNMKTAVETIFVGKERTYNRRFWGSPQKTENKAR